MGLTVWGRATSVNVQKVLWALDELGLGYEHRVVGGKHGGLDGAAFRAVSMVPMVPVLVDGDLNIRESNTILRHLARREGRLGAPETPVDMWMEYGTATLQPAFIGLFYQRVRMRPEERDAGAEAASLAKLTGALDVIGQELADGRDHLVGEFSIADIALGTPMYRACDIAPGLLADLPQVAAWVDRLAARPGWGRWIATSYDDLRPAP